METRRFMTVAEAADVLATSPVQIMAMIKRGELRAIQIGGRGQWRVEAAELDRYIEEAYKKFDAQRSTADRDESIKSD
jgi:excisionase family DNA binding protein